MDKISGFVAYPSEPVLIGQTINGSIQNLTLADQLNIKSWEEMDIPGRFIHTEVMSAISASDFLIGDISILNFNVVFEIGYAIGVGKRVITIRNRAISEDKILIKGIGIFDGLGHKSYSDSKSLTEIIKGINDINPIHFDSTNVNNNSPIYIVLPPDKGESETRLISRVKKAGLFFRSFDPLEQGRMSAVEAIENVASSHGVIIPLLENYRSGVKIHNMRCAFVAGLAYGMDKKCLIIQNGSDPIPLDFSELTKRFNNISQINGIIADFAPEITISIQSVKPRIRDYQGSLLNNISIGASAAENEYRTLSEYYLKTDEFLSVERGEAQCVLGRKGSGKSALFFQLRDKLRAKRQITVIDLKPEGFQLIKFKEQVLDYLEEGTRAHTITAFWEYLLLLEICNKLLEEDKTKAIRDHSLYTQYKEIEDLYYANQYKTESDFVERMLALTKRISETFLLKPDWQLGNVRLQTGEITHLLHQHNVIELRNLLVKYLQRRDGLWILIDNLDKGWKPHGVSEEDVTTLKCLIDAMSKIQREFRYKEIETSCVLFIRNDVYEKLVYSTSDRGKISQVLIDWADKDLLKEMLRKRLINNEMISDNPSFNEIWQTICVSHIDGHESSDYIIERCLMRPRALIELFKQCKSHAVNLNHEKINKDDVLYGEEMYSNKMVNDIGYEIQDLLPGANDALLEFMGCSSKLSRNALDKILEGIVKANIDKNEFFELLVWYGFIGFEGEDGDPVFIYNVKYDIKKLLKMIELKEKEGIVFVINPAFWKGLEIIRSGE